MITVDEALQLIRRRATPRPGCVVSTDAALGLVLDECVASDVDSPAHDKSLVDGYAIRAADLASGRAELRVLEQVLAGRVPQHPVDPGTAIRIMTGAPLPVGADAVVMVERTQTGPQVAGGPWQVSIEDRPARPGQNIMRRAQSLSRGQQVLEPGHALRAIEIGLLAEVGRTSVRAIPRPTVAVLATGDELVPASQTPGPAQIRNSNGPMLLAQVRRAGAIPVDLGQVVDERAALGNAIRQGLSSDILVLSGGVSAGDADLVPELLRECQVSEVFHKVRVKPGKPVWFGVASGPSGERLVFGLPGNPVSSLVCFELFVRPAIGMLAGRGVLALPVSQGRLGAPFRHTGDRPTYYPAVLAAVDLDAPPRPREIRLLNWQGSSDLRTLAGANCLAVFSEPDHEYQAGEVLTVRELD